MDRGCTYEKRPDSTSRGELGERCNAEGLWSEVVSLASLQAAWQQLSHGSRGHGVDGEDAAQLAPRIDQVLAALSVDLAAERWVPSPGRVVDIPKPSGGSRRLSIPTVRDRIVQVALRQVMSPRIEAVGATYSYAYRPKRGVRRATGRVAHVIHHDRCTHVARCDIRKFFDRIDQDILLAQCAPLLPDPRLLRVLRLLLTAGQLTPRGRFVDLATGVPTGSSLAPDLANLYLTDFDHHLGGSLRAHEGYVRYADDFVLLTRSRDRAEALAAIAEAYLVDHLKLTLNAEKSGVSAVAAGFDFLGIRHDGQTLAISNRKRREIQARLDRWAHQARARPVAAAQGRLAEMAAGWGLHYGRRELGDSLRWLDLRIAAAAGRVERGRRAQGGAIGAVSPRRWLAAIPRLAAGRGDPRERAFRAALKTAATRRPVAAPATKAAKARKKGQKEAAPTATPTATPTTTPTATPTATPAPRVAAPGTLTSGQRRRQQTMARRHEQARVARAEVAVASPGSHLALRDRKLIITRGRKRRRVVRLDRLQAVTVAGRGVSLSVDLVAALAQARVPLFITAAHGRPVASLSPVGTVQSEAIAQQALAGVGRLGVTLACAFLDGKLRNSAGLLRVRAKHATEPSLRDALLGAKTTILTTRAKLITAQADASSMTGQLRARLMGLEGHAARVYWQAIAALLGEAAGFPGRRHRGAALDAVNCCLNYGYGVLYQRIERAIIVAGLSPQLGFLHMNGPRRVGLVWDMIEEHRAFWVDRIVTAMVSRGEAMVVDAGRLDDVTRRRLLSHLLGHLGATTIYRGERRNFDEVLRAQLSALKKTLAGEARYTPFVARW